MNFTETAAVVIVVAGIMVAVVQTDVQKTFHDAVREMVCLVRGPDCDSETWTEHDDDDPPEEWAGMVPPGDGSGNAGPAIAWAKSHLGFPYGWGATGPRAYDCSSFVQAAWRAGGVNIPRVTTDQYGALPHVSVANLKPGDLLFFHTMPGHPSPSHVSMYIGGGQMIHAANSDRGVVQDSFVRNSYYQSVFVGAARPG